VTKVAWQATCSFCKQQFPLEEREAHATICEATGKARMLAEVERPRTWAFGLGLVRESFVEQERGPMLRKFFIGVTENPVARSQLVAFRDLITLVLEEAPEPVAAIPMPPAPVADATGAA